MKRAIFFMIALSIMLVIPAAGYCESVRAVVDRTQMTREDTLSLTVISDFGRSSVDTSPIKDFRILSHGTSSNIQWINGKTTNEFRHSYELMPLKKGKLSIPSLPVIKSGGKTFYTRGIVIHVTDTPVAEGANRDVFVTATVSDRSPYVGQPVLYTFSLYSAVQIANARLDRPEFEGFDAKEIEGEKSGRTIVDGREYMVTQIQTILVPLKEGITPITPSVLSCDMVVQERRRRRSPDPFDSFFDDSRFSRSRLKRKVLRTESIGLEVKALPPYNLDLPYSGLVGRAALDASVESARIKAGDSTTLTVTLQGSGNFLDVSEPAIQIPEGFKSYKDAPEEEITQGPHGYQGKKVFRMALVAVEPGNYTIPPVRLSYFDVAKGSYQVASSRPFHLEVMAVAGEDRAEPQAQDQLPAETRPAITKKKVEYTGRDILPIKEGIDATLDNRPMAFTTYLMLLLIPVILTGLLKMILIVRGKEITASSAMAKRAQSALKEAARKDISNEEFLAAIYKAFASSIFSRAATAGETVTTAEARKILETQGYPQEIVDSATDILAKIESARFGGHTPDRHFREALLSETSAVVRRIL